MISWDTIVSTIRAWVADATQSTCGGRVQWANQGGPRLQAPFVELEITSVESLGQDWKTVKDNQASNGHDGAEIIRTAMGPRVMTLAIRCFGASGPLVPSAAPVGVLDAVVTLSSLRTTAFAAAGMGRAGFGMVISTKGVIDETVLEPRAVVDARFHLAAEVAEFETYIQTVKYQGTIDGVDQPVVTVDRYQ